MNLSGQDMELLAPVHPVMVLHVAEILEDI